MKELTFITGNDHKVKALERWLGFRLAHQKIDVEELQSLDPFKVVEHKAKSAYAIIRSPVLVEDTSLVFHALGRLPGTFIKHFIEEVGLEELCNLLDGFDDKTATARVIYAIYDGEKLDTFEGIVNGIIPDTARGEGGFGWDPVFIPNASNKTYAEMNQAEGNPEFSHYSVRNQAVLKLKAFLDE